MPHYEWLQEEIQNEADYLWFGVGRFKDVLASVQACGFFALDHQDELEIVCSLFEEERLVGIVEKARARGDKDSVYDEDDSRMRARERWDAREEREYLSAEQKQEETEFKAGSITGEMRTSTIATKQIVQL